MTGEHKNRNMENGTRTKEKTPTNTKTSIKKDYRKYNKNRVWDYNANQKDTRCPEFLIKKAKLDEITEYVLQTIQAVLKEKQKTERRRE